MEETELNFDGAMRGLYAFLVSAHAHWPPVAAARREALRREQQQRERHDAGATTSAAAAVAAARAAAALSVADESSGGPSASGSSSGGGASSSSGGGAGGSGGGDASGVEAMEEWVEAAATFDLGRHRSKLEDGHLSSTRQKRVRRRRSPARDLLPPPA